jgi:hypothetical protein
MDGLLSRIATALADAERDRLRRNLGCHRREKDIGAEGQKRVALGKIVVEGFRGFDARQRQAMLAW